MLSSGQATGTLDTILHSMVDNAQKKLIMASIKANALYAWMFASSRVEIEAGGANITSPMVFGRNPNVTSTQYYNPIPITETSEFNTARYGWSRVVGSMMISDQEEAENEGPQALFKVLQAKLDVLVESIQEKFADYLYGSGTGTDPNGLANTVPDDPTTGSIGGLSRVTEQQWRTSAYDFGGGLDATNIEEAFDDILMDLKQKAEGPDIILVGRNIQRFYRQAVRDKTMISLGSGGTGGKAMVDLGFGGFTHNKIPLVYDEDCPVNKAYFLNSKYLRFHILKGQNMKRKNLVAPWTIDASGVRIVWQGQLCLWKAYRTHAVVDAA